MNFNGYEVIDYEVKKHTLRSAKLTPDGVFLLNLVCKVLKVR